MRSGVIAQKLGMTRIFTDAGEHIPVTVLRLERCQVMTWQRYALAPRGPSSMGVGR